MLIHHNSIFLKCGRVYAWVFSTLLCTSSYALRTLMQWKDLSLELFLPSKEYFSCLVFLIVYAPLAFGRNVVCSPPSCGFVYYFINAIIVLALIWDSWLTHVLLGSTSQWRIQEFIEGGGGAGQCARKARAKNFTTTPTSFKPSRPFWDAHY